MFEAIILGILLSTGVYVVWRYRKESVYTERLAHVLPSEEKLQWENPEDKLNGVKIRTRNPRFASRWREAGGVGAVGGIPSMYYLSKVDPKVIDSLDFAFADDLSNFNNLTDYVSDKYLDVLNTDSADGWMTRFEGYVMEMHSADVLEEMGYDVELPDASNQEGWDVLLDGEPWQIKGGETPQVIANHFETYPDIPVITNEDLGTAYEGYDNVMVLDDISAEKIHEMAHDSLTSIDQIDSTMGAGIPVVSLIMSSYREVKLHSQNKTDFGSSMKNVGLDAAGVGGGGYAGAQTGAVIGAVGGPAGAVVGGVVVGIVGAVGGKVGTNIVKEKSMKEAFYDYENTVKRVQQAIEHDQEKERLAITAMVEKVNTDLNSAKSTIEASYQKQFDEKKDDVVEKQKAFLNEVPKILQSIKEELQEFEKGLAENYEPSFVLKRWLNPSYDDVAYRKLKSWFKQRYVIIDQGLKKFSKALSEEKSHQKIQQQYAEAITFFRDYSVVSEHLDDVLASVVYETDKVEKTRDRMKKDFYLHLLQAKEKMRQGTQDSFRSLAEKALVEKEQIQQAYDRYINQREKLGR
ncbi:hypothetical protein [Salisediminibacterium halotolerans]|uniref:hypothetical protein n=1 Tax=Salisediminibacterium halotolerans TaxID=517425 RepID=UPI000F237F43|nr:hypothetical protein [Salisediminibacterium halotolerans]RLJ75535.1 hypothetical protein BCL39_1051 [Actinophytocola xinjiangensis]RPE89388.1 hypothetical protein EDD67_0164 [Salisediminibacterium halotolerans]TWG36148.1 hypothetical protein BCL52_1049 [Salisediminibacterium halotolerans]GEL07625.1 hypothetical protein SHA02_10410 [Salisediminibacterium halotolerans]